MRNFRRTLPPLDYLLFFEAVARHKSFTKAAGELNVSQAAVSKRVKHLENWMGKPLVSRNGPKIELTADGYLLASYTTESLEHLSLCFNKIKTANDIPFTLAANTTVSQYWLAPRINDYLLSNNATPVRLTSSDRDSDLLSLDNDLVIYYGSDIPVGWDGISLFEEVWVPLISPSLINDNTDYGALTLLDFDKLAPKWINWPAFLNLVESQDFKDATQINLDTYGRSLDAAIKGKGIALGCPEVLHFELEANRLLTLDRFKIKTGRNYFAMWKSGSKNQVITDIVSGFR
jgi:DNA-binding transcriptional LysR family regulator